MGQVMGRVRVRMKMSGLYDDKDEDEYDVKRRTGDVWCLYGMKVATTATISDSVYLWITRDRTDTVQLPTFEQVVTLDLEVKL